VLKKVTKLLLFGKAKDVPATQRVLDLSKIDSMSLVVRLPTQKL